MGGGENRLIAATLCVFIAAERTMRDALHIATRASYVRIPVSTPASDTRPLA